MPLQAEFSTELLTNEPDDELNWTISDAIGSFLRFTFGWKAGTTIPTLEDIFTMIDLSAGTGHYLGPENSPKRLRALRRMLIYRVFSILDRRFKRSDEIDQLLSEIGARDPNPAFIVLNWDIVLERHLESAISHPGVSYCVNEHPWAGSIERGILSRVIKVHGSANWVYCDNCRNIFFDRDRKLSLALKAGLCDEDLALFNGKWKVGDIAKGMPTADRDCRRCHIPVGPHIATFSFKKSFRTAAFSRSWLAAEEALCEADRWLFVGYSLPDADYEFAHLLKTAELKLGRCDLRPKRIEVVVCNDRRAEVKFRQLFGTAIAHVDQRGLGGYVSDRLASFVI